jgi:hypothetical protein
MWFKINKTILIQLLYLSLTGITSLQKIIPLEIPEWFINKFQATLIGKFPYGLAISFLIITILESSISLLILISIIKKEFKTINEIRFFNMALDLSLILFLVLFFGSFLANDYENGALDFIYFIGTYFISQKLNSKKVNIN